MTILRRVAAALLILALSGGLTGCDRSSDAPRREQEPVNPGGGKDDGGKKPDNPGGDNRPGIKDEPADFATELADATLRYVGGGNTLRFDRGGVLFKTLPDGSREIIDLDKGLRVEVRAGSMRADSLSPDARVTVGGKRLELESFRMKKQTAEAVWYHAVDSESKSYVLVLP